MKIKTGDKVKIISGKDAGKTGKILQIMVAEKKVVVEGLNLMIKHQRPRREGEKGQRIQFPAPFSAAKVMLVCPKCGQAVRISYRFEMAPSSESAAKNSPAKKKIKHRVCGKCKEII